MANDNGGAIQRHEFNAIETRQDNELAKTGAAEAQRAIVESAYTIAIRRPRNMMTVRDRLLKECDRPRFADAAEYKLPFKKWNKDAKKYEEEIKRGLSIRFAESALSALGNIMIRSTILLDDDNKIVGEVVAIDLETNVMHTEPFVSYKRTEKKEPGKYDEIVDRRLNSLGEETYIVKSKEGDIEKNMRRALQKAKRNAILEILPADIKEEAAEKCQAVVKKGIKDDPTAYMKKLADGFSGIGIGPESIEEYLGHPIAAITPDEILELKDVFGAIRDGESTWAEIMERGRKTEDAKPLTDAEKAERAQILTFAAKTNVDRPKVHAAALAALRLPANAKPDAMKFPLLKQFGAALKAELDKAATAADPKAAEKKETK